MKFNNLKLLSDWYKQFINPNIQYLDLKKDDILLKVNRILESSSEVDLNNMLTRQREIYDKATTMLDNMLIDYNIADRISNSVRLWITSVCLDSDEMKIYVFGLKQHMFVNDIKVLNLSDIKRIFTKGIISNQNLLKLLKMQKINEIDNMIDIKNLELHYVE